MKAWLCLAATVLFASGCNREADRPAAASAPASDVTRTADGAVIIPPDSPKMQQIRVEPVKEAEIPVDEVVSPGKIEVNPNRVSRVLLPVPGRISTVLVRIGDAVRQGDPLLTIESPEADAGESAYLQAQAGLNQANSGLLKAQADHERAADLLAHDAVAKKEVLNAENALAQAMAAVEQARAAREQAIRRLGLLGLKPGSFGQKITVAAPIAGKVLEMTVAPGEYRNDTNAPLITIADLSTVWVSSDVPESSIRLIQLGERVQITLAAYPGEEFRGRVTRIADTVDPQTRTIKVRAEMDNSHGRFRPEMFGTIRHSDATRTMCVVPSGAVIQGEGRSIVFREESPGHFRQTAVRLGKAYNDMIPVTGGLKAGDRVVVDGAMLLKGQ